MILVMNYLVKNKQEQYATVATIVIVLVQCAFLSVSFFLTESALKKKFH